MTGELEGYVELKKGSGYNDLSTEIFENSFGSDQKFTMIIIRWFNVDCSQAEGFYFLNDEIAAEREANSPSAGNHNTL